MEQLTDVAKLLQDKDIPFTSSGRDYLITCPNPDHLDSNPSFRVDKLSGVGHCFACGHSMNMFKAYGIIVSYQNTVVSNIKEKIARIISSTTSLEFPKGYTPFMRDFRGISHKTLSHFGAFTVIGNNEHDLEDRVIFPLKDSRDKIVGFIGRHTNNIAQPRYRIYPSGIEMPMFPSKISPINGTVFIVEGIFDALNLIDKGLTNVVAIMGVNSLYSMKKGLNVDKISLLKLQGITKIVILFDGDPAGYTTAEKLKPELEKANFIVSVIDLEEGTDPGDLSQEDVDSLRKFI